MVNNNCWKIVSWLLWEIWFIIWTEFSSCTKYTLVWYFEWKKRFFLYQSKCACVWVFIFHSRNSIPSSAIFFLYSLPLTLERWKILSGLVVSICFSFCSSIRFLFKREAKKIFHTIYFFFPMYIVQLPFSSDDICCCMRRASPLSVTVPFSHSSLLSLTSVVKISGVHFKSSVNLTCFFNKLVFFLRWKGDFVKTAISKL